MTAKTIVLEYEIGEFVYLVTDREQERRIVTAVSIREKGIAYELSCGTETSWHGPKEISTERQTVVI